MEPATARRSPPQDLESLVRAHQKPVWRYLRLLGADPGEADDLMQETFLRAAGQVQAGRQLRAPGAFLRTVARNLLVSSRHRSGRATPTVEWSDAVEEVLQERAEILSDHRLEAIQACLPQLRGRARLAIEMHYLEAQDYRQVAAELDLSTNGLKALLQRARQVLRRCAEGRLNGER